MIRIVGRYVSIKNQNNEVDLDVTLSKENNIIFSQNLKPETSTGYAKDEKFKRKYVGYWDYGTLSIPSNGTYQIKIIPNNSLVNFSNFDILISKNNSKDTVFFWGILSGITFLIGMFFWQTHKNYFEVIK